jgi:flagellar basal body rod protein FlgG
MNYGLYLSASGVLTNLYRQDVYANNLANAQTVGFKPDVPTVAQRDPESVEGSFGSVLRQRVLDQQGGGVWPGSQRIDFSQGTLVPTGKPLDVALQRDDAFFAVRSTDARGNQSIALTRDGRFSLNAKSQLVTSAGGRPVLDARDQPITVSGDAPVSIEPDGRVVQAGETIAKLQVTAVSDARRLSKQGQNLLTYTGADPRKPLAGTVDLKSGHTESSAVDPITTLNSLINATRAVSDAASMIHYHDTVMDKAVNTLGRVA